MSRAASSNRLAIAVTVVVLVVFVLGLWAGRVLTKVRFATTIAQWDRAQTLGALVADDDDRRSRALAYEAPATAETDMDGYGWAPANVPTPFVGVGPAPGAHTGVTINAQQFRGAREVVMPKPEGTFRVFVTGGSTAFSSGAPSLDRTIGGQLEACLAKRRQGVEVFTFANPAWASTQERIAIENRLSELAPDVVIAFTGVNDIHWGVRGRDTMWFRTYWDETFFQLDRAAFELVGRALVDPTVVTEAPIPVVRLADNFTKNVQIAAFVLSSVGAKYVVALQPNLAVSTKQRTAREEALLAKLGEERREHYEAGFREFAARLQKVDAAEFLWWDLSDVFRGRTEEIFLDNYHFGDRGNAIIGATLCEHLVEEVGL